MHHNCFMLTVGNHKNDDEVIAILREVPVPICEYFIAREEGHLPNEALLSTARQAEHPELSLQKHTHILVRYGDLVMDSGHLFPEGVHYTAVLKGEYRSYLVFMAKKDNLCRDEIWVYYPQVIETMRTMQEIYDMYKGNFKACISDSHYMGHAEGLQLVFRILAR